MTAKTYAESAAGLAHGATEFFEQGVIFALLAINDTLLEVRDAIEADRTTCTDPDRSEGHCCGIEEWEPDPTHDDWVRFAKQNPHTANVTPEVLVDLMPYASHHAGGLYVLQRDVTVNGRDLQVKLHDTWGDTGENGEQIVLHIYDPDGPDAQVQHMYHTGNKAAGRFLNDPYLIAWWRRRGPKRGDA